jgi:hypothetical protein
MEHDCIPDEHYVQTLFSINGHENELERRTLTYTSWNQSSDPKDKMTWHPMTFEYESASPEQINSIKVISVDFVLSSFFFFFSWLVNDKKALVFYLTCLPHNLSIS